VTARSTEIFVGPSVVRLGEVDLPGHVQRVDVSGSVRSDEATVPGRSGVSRQPLGYEDAEVVVSLLLLDRPEGESALQQAGRLGALYANVDERARPSVFRLVNAHTIARGIRDVVWRSLRTRERGAGAVEAELVFVEFQPAVVKKERAAAATTAASEESARGAAAIVLGLQIATTATAVAYQSVKGWVKSLAAPKTAATPANPGWAQMMTEQRIPRRSWRM
jgi:hypothetical protein